jgi:nuclear pore complex protein Nup214
LLGIDTVLEFRISDPSDLPQTTPSSIEDSNVNKQISPATVSGKDLTPIVTSSMAKSLLAEPGAEPSTSSAQAGKRWLRRSY